MLFIAAIRSNKWSHVLDSVQEKDNNYNVTLITKFYGNKISNKILNLLKTNAL